ncbi:MAG: FAD/NAD(P)-binding protein [Chloroflexota bacterium]
MRTVVIVGGGAAGTLVALHLAARGAGRPGSPLGEVVVVDPAERLGEGVAYGTTSSAHLLNVRADGMSAFPDVATHFTAWARATGSEVGGAEFLPRMLYPRYLRDSLAAATADAPEAVRHVHARAVGLSVDGPVARVSLSDGTGLDADEVVLATGNGLAPLAWLPDTPRVIRDAWVPGALGGIPPDARVVIVGSGLSAVDVVLSLRDRAHAGPVTMISSHGLLPEPHRTDVLPMRTAAFEPSATIGARALVRALRADAELADDWRQTVDGVRPVTVATWQALPMSERRRALRHAFRQWEVRRHRMAPEVAAVLTAERAAGRLALVRGRVRGVDDVGGQLAVRIETGGSGATVAADVVIACVGPSADPRHDPLLAGMLSDGAIARHPLGLGLDVDDLGRARRPDGASLAHVWTVGSLRRGAEWESTAVPELRVHAAAIAEALASEP